MIAGAVLFAAILAAPSAAPATCALHAQGSLWMGSCGPLVEDAATTVSIARSASITSGAWQRDLKPQTSWSGTMAAGDDPATPVELEIYADRRGLLRSVYGWFPVSGFVRANATLRFRVDRAREAAPSSTDREIILHAKRILANAAAWNRADNRQCPATALSWSIYCALEKATIDVAGAFHHRRPALQIVRQLVDERTAGRPYEHRLMDYNNDPATTLADVQELFDESLRRIEAQSARPKHIQH